MASASPPGALIRQYKCGMLPLDPACSPIVATLILYGRWLGLLMASILSPGARIIQHKCGKRSDGGREAGEGSDNFHLEGVLALSISSSWLASFPIRKKPASFVSLFRERPLTL